MAGSKVVRLGDVRLAVLDSDVIHDLSKRPDVATERLSALRNEGLVTAITHRVLSEITATRNEEKRQRLLEAVLSRVEVFFPFEALDLVQMEVNEPDPPSVIGAHELLSVRYIETLTFAKEAVEAFSAGNREQRARLKAMAPQSDPRVKTLVGLASFAEHVRLQEVEEAKEFLEYIRSQGRLCAVDTSPEALRALLDRGKTTRMTVLATLAFYYHRAERRLQNKTPKSEGAMSDFPFLGAAAYSQVLLTADMTFAECGALVNQVVAEPKIRLWEL